MSTSTPARSGAKAKQSKKVILLLRQELLSRWPSDSLPSSKPATSDESSAPASTPIINAPETEKTSESNESPGPNTTAATDDGNSLAPPKETKRKGVPGPKPGSKRSAPSSDVQPKPRGKPGPKKKPRLADGSIDRSAETTKKGPFGGVAPITAHKLGPKANTGAINAGLRALDRSGKPCRKWERRGFTMKSITGIAWSVGSWAAPPKDNTFSGDIKSESSGSSETKNNMESSAVPSERSNSNVDGYGAGQLESSPAPVISTPA
ncbi:INO80 complex, subunit Ies4 [Delphinella strobiligena]|nr:INO80 complex, subunit Ies4 [Delphinella strobiligena]